MRTFKPCRTFAFAMALGLTFALPAAGQTASSESAAGHAPDASAAAGGTALGGSSGSGGQGAGADLRTAASGPMRSAGLDPVRAESARGRDWNTLAGWLAALGLLVLVCLAALRIRHELARQRREGRTRGEEVPAKSPRARQPRSESM